MYQKMTRNDSIPFGTAAIRNKDCCIVLWVNEDVQQTRVRSGQVRRSGQRAFKYPDHKDGGNGRRYMGKQDKHTKFIRHQQRQ